MKADSWSCNGYCSLRKPHGHNIIPIMFLRIHAYFQSALPRYYATMHVLSPHFQLLKPLASHFPLHRRPNLTAILAQTSHHILLKEPWCVCRVSAATRLLSTAPYDVWRRSSMNHLCPYSYLYARGGALVTFACKKQVVASLCSSWHWRAGHGMA